MAIATLPNGARAAYFSPASGLNARARMTLTLTWSHGLESAFTVVGLRGSEGISQLFHYELDLVADPAKAIDFELVLGAHASIEFPLPGGGYRRIYGAISRLTEKRRDQTHAHFQAEVVPRFWFATKIAQSRVFQGLDVVEIMNAVFESVPVPYRSYIERRIQGQYPKRPYCVQYRETDFHFLSRLMEEEGIYFFFNHNEHLNPFAHLVISDTPLRHPDLQEPSDVKLDDTGGGNRPEDRITDWQKTQEMRAGRYTLWDHSFELPQSHLEATKMPVPSVRAGSVEHRFDRQVELELYDYPGDYAKRFDGVNHGGGDQAAKLTEVFGDNERTAAIRMEQEALPGLIINGTGNCRHFEAGYKFTLEVQDPRRPSSWKPEGEYLLTAVHHRATQSFDRSGNFEAFDYKNTFSCIPVALPFRPLRRTPRPVIQGTQTAQVVGNGTEGEEILTDKYGRVKVRFFWDRRDLKGNPDSCWIRVAQAWAGKRWGTSFWPRIGQEVVVAFEEGDPDKPIIIGSVYNAQQMPPYLGDGLDPAHKHDNKVSGIKTCTTPGGDGFNEIRFNDTKGKEQLFLHAQCTLDVRANGSQRTSLGGDQHLSVHGSIRASVGQDEERIVKGDLLSHVEGEYITWVGKRLLLGSTDDVTLKAQNGDIGIVSHANGISIEAKRELRLECGASVIVLTPEGIIIKAPKVEINPTAPLTPFVFVNAWVDPRAEARAPSPADSAKTGYPSIPKPDQGAIAG